MKINIRVATSDDQDFLHKLNRLAYEDVVCRQFGNWDDSAQRQKFNEKLEKASFRIVEIEGQPVAAVWSSEENDHVRIHELLVIPEFQNRGIGSKILKLEIDHAKLKNKPIRLHTLLMNRAQELYKRYGFKETGRSEVFIDMERPE